MAVLLVLAMVSCKNEVHEHTFAEKWSSDATNHWHAATCEHTEEKDGFAKHVFGDWIVDTEPEFSKNGSKHRICTVCEYKETASIPMTGHVHEESDGWSKDETGHWKTCKVDENCSYEFDKKEHSFVWKQNESGDKHYQECSICGYETEEKEHSYGTTPEGRIIGEKAFYGVFCNDCGTIYETLNYELYVVKEADDFQKGFESGNSMFYLANDLEIPETGKMEFTNEMTFIYLNDKKLTLHGQLSVGGIDRKNEEGNSIPSFFGAEKGTVNFDITGLAADNNAVEISKNGVFYVKDVDIKSNIGGIFSVNNEDNTEIIIEGGSLTAEGYYAIGTNAEKPAAVNVHIGLLNTEVTAKYSALNGGDNTGLLFNVNGQVYIKDSTITADRQAVILRTGGEENNPHGIVDSTLIVTGNNTVKNNHYGTTDNWSSGNEVPSAALVVGNKTAGDGYKIPTYALVKNVTIEIGEDANESYKAVCVAKANNCAVKLEISFADGRSIESDVYKATEIDSLSTIAN